MITYPNAKINIGLSILNKRPDGFHNLESIFYPVAWFDILEINKADEFEFKTSGLIINGDDKDNLIVKAFNLIKEQYNISNCRIHLHKQIPMGAGLGGGSSDAAFTLTVLNKLFNLKIPDSQLIELADYLGSDCPFFIDNKPKIVSGKGEVLEDIDFSIKGYYIKLINPNIHISTKEAFANLKIEKKQNSLLLKNLTSKMLFSEHSEIKNDFEQGIFKLYPDLLKIKKQLIQEGAMYASMSGTGSTIYGIFKSKPKSTFYHNTFTEKIIAFKS
jgi:4-diphosphocytidyl-2-C-methyl-D-erythritol kinase